MREILRPCRDIPSRPFMQRKDKKMPKMPEMPELIAAVSDALIRRQEVERLTGLGRSAIYARIDPNHSQHDPTFPRPVPLGSTHAVRWVSGEVSAWIKARIAERDNRKAA
jgi:prophage regulatory protein